MATPAKSPLENGWLVDKIHWGASCSLIPVADRDGLEGRHSGEEFHQQGIGTVEEIIQASLG